MEHSPRKPVQAAAFGIVEKPLSQWERIYNVGGLRKLFMLVVLALVWEVYARRLDNPLLFPTFSATLQAFFHELVGRRPAGQGWTSIKSC